MIEADATYLPTGRRVGVTGLRRRSAGELVVLPRRSYEALARRAEDAEDAGVVRAARAADDGDYLPAEAVKRLVAGEHPVRVWREHRGMTLRGLAARAGVAPAHLSRIENREKPGGLGALKRLAAALGIGLEDVA
jgi:hypothetical protein